jgi:hypothetical protein
VDIGDVMISSSRNATDIAADAEMVAMHEPREGQDALQTTLRFESMSV